MTRTIILAAGSGNRLQPHTNDRPKCFVEINGNRLIDWQIKTLNSCGLNDITIVTGYRSEMIESLSHHTIHNPHWSETNMVYTLWCAREKLVDDVILAYADIVYEPSVVQSVLNAEDNISVVIDTDFYPYWQMRMENPLLDLESLKLNDMGEIIDIGQKTANLEEIQGQYIGMMRFRKNGLKNLVNTLSNMQQNKNEKFKKMYMTDLLQAMILQNNVLKAVPIHHKWLEIDTVKDYQMVQRMQSDGSLSQFFDFSHINPK